MATTLETQQPWVPYEPTKDCSQGFCSIYCPQWCYVIFPPPPPLTLSDDDDDAGSGTAFSPLVIAIIGILATAFLLVSYYTIVSKYCGASIRRSRRPPGPGGEDDPGQPRRHEAARASSNGLDEALINKITTHRYRRGEGAINGTDCPVCLGEFREDDSLRLLPKCRHAFHLHCIDTWLKSHSNCPLCRANIVSAAAAEIPPLPHSPAPPPPPPPTELENNPLDREMVVVTTEDVNRNGEEARGLENGCDASKDPSLAPSDSGGRQQSCDSSRIGDDGGAQPIRRSVSGGRFCFTGNGGRGRSPVLPI